MKRAIGIVGPSRRKPVTCESCEAPVIWAVTERGRRMPVDAQLNATGNLVLCYEVDHLDRPVSGQMVVVAMDHYAGPRWISHFATCPKASFYRRQQAQRGEA